MDKAKSREEGKERPGSGVYAAAAESTWCAVHHGPFSEIQQAYDAVLKWIDEGGYRIVVPAREVVLQAPAQAKAGSDVAADQSDPNGITEIQYPVEKGK